MLLAIIILILALTFHDLSHVTIILILALTFKPPFMQRTASSAHLTMSSYLESINDNNEGEDEGVFF